MDVDYDEPLPPHEPDEAEAEFNPESVAQSFALASWQVMHDFEESDSEGYEKLSALSRKLRCNIIDQMTSATDAPHAVAVTIFTVEFMTMFLAKIVDTAKNVPEEMARKAGLHGVSGAEFFDVIAQGLMKMCKQLYEAGNERAEASPEDHEELDENDKIVAFVAS